jgi:hypothetical protein
MRANSISDVPRSPGLAFGLEIFTTPTFATCPDLGGGAVDFDDGVLLGPGFTFLAASFLDTSAAPPHLFQNLIQATTIQNICRNKGIVLPWSKTP